jgi:multiple sugar transport system substrate-binding protein
MTVNRGGDGGYLVNRVLNGWGATWVDETGEIVTINSPEAVAAVEWLVDIYTNPDWAEMLPPGVESWTDTHNNEAYVGERVAYTQNAGTVYASAVANGLPVAEVTAYHPPCGGPVVQEFNGLGGMYMHLITGAKNPSSARELIMSFFNEDILRAIYTASPAYVVPGYSTMWDWEEITNYPIAVALQPVALDPSGWTGLSWPGPSTAQMGAVGNGNLHTDMIANVINGQMTAAESVQDAHEKSVAIFKEFGAPGE